MMENTIMDSIKEIIERADECKKSQQTDFDKGRLMAFNEVLSIIKTDFTGDERVEALLDFDIDGRY